MENMKVRVSFALLFIDTMVCGKKEKSMVSECTMKELHNYMKASGKMIRNMDLEHLLENKLINILDNGKREGKAVMVNATTIQELYTRGNGVLIVEKDKVFINMKMVTNMTECG